MAKPESTASAKPMAEPERLAEPQVFEAIVEVEPAAALPLLAETAELWGAEWQPAGVAEGRLTLPVMAGLRRGWVRGTVRVDRHEQGARLTFGVEERLFRTDVPAFVTLLIAAVGALMTLVAPFFPRLWPLVPAGIFLALGAWLFIVARLRNSGPEEFFKELEDRSMPADESEKNPSPEE